MVLESSMGGNDGGVDLQGRPSDRFANPPGPAQGSVMGNDPETLGPARFFDESNRDRGCAGGVTKRINDVTGLAVLDVTASEPALALFLTTLDKHRLTVHANGLSGESYSFEWASGYDNGDRIRVQGVLKA
jgi:hypothetical protein